MIGIDGDCANGFVRVSDQNTRYEIPTTKHDTCDL